MADDRVEHLLAEAARLWPLDINGDPFPDGLYSSTGNRFLVEAESAFLAQLEHHQQTRTER